MKASFVVEEKPRTKNTDVKGGEGQSSTNMVYATESAIELTRTLRMNVSAYALLWKVSLSLKCIYFLESYLKPWSLVGSQIIIKTGNGVDCKGKFHAYIHFHSRGD